MCKESNIKIVVSRTPAYSSDSSASDGEDEMRYQNWQTMNGRVSKVKVILPFDDAVERYKEYVRELKPHIFT